MPGLGDHVLVAVIALAFPLYSAMSWSRRDLPELQTGGPGARNRFYRRTMLELWLLTAAVVAWWLWSGRTLAGIGLGVPGGWGFWIGLLVVVAAAIVLGRQVAAVRASAEAQEQVRRQLEGAVGAGAGLMIPRDDHERRVWVGLSLTAGVCEEVLYRAFLIGYLMAWLPMIVAAALASVVFGAAHGYLGRGGMVRAMVTGAFLAVAYLWTGSIWVPIALHAVLDVTSGLTGSVALGDEG